MGVATHILTQSKQKTPVWKSLRNLILATPLRVAAPATVVLQDSSPSRVNFLLFLLEFFFFSDLRLCFAEGKEK